MAPSPPQITQSSTLPPAQPVYVLRGHSAQIHAVHFFRRNLRLLTGDADGWVVLWNLPIRRPVAVWKAHNATILGLNSWGDERILSHGRDNKLVVWQVRPEDEAELSSALPIDDTTTKRREPWILHSLDVNALNFCSFAMCSLNPNPNPTQSPSTKEETKGDDATSSKDEILVAVPGLEDGMVNITSLPSEKRFATLPSPKLVKTGMVMALGLYHSVNSDAVSVLAGYESGHAALWRRNNTGVWEAVYMQKAHSQPILSLDLAPVLGMWFTSSADAVIARHQLQADSSSTCKTVQTKHAGQQDLKVRSDGKIFTTAGWDGRARVYSAKSMKELAVLKWHKEGCYALDFARVTDKHALGDGGDEESEEPNAVAKRTKTVAEQREARTMDTHWLAVGSKDGKVSLWDIY